MSDIQKLAYYQREVAKMAAFTSTATRLAGCVDPALLKAGVIGSQLQATGMINPSLARFIAEQKLNHAKNFIRAWQHSCMPTPISLRQ